MGILVVYNLLVVGLDWAGLRWLARHRSAAGLLQASTFFLVTTAGLALTGMSAHIASRYYGSPFTVMGLYSCALFAHGIPLLIIAAWVLRADAPRLALLCGSTAAVVVGVAVQAFLIEPSALEVTHHEIRTAKIDEPIRIVVLADLQADSLGPYERRAIRWALREEPDLLLLTGDYLQVTRDDYAPFVAELNAMFRTEQLAAPLGVHAVEGNVDRIGWESIFADLAVTTYVETATTRVTDSLAVTGLSFSGSFDVEQVVDSAPGFHIVFGHAPDFALGEVEADLLIAGHTHGGQVQLPGVGPLLTLSRVPRAWASGRTELAGERTLIVSRGVGMERGLAPRVRLFCRPELVVIDLIPAPTDGSN